MSDIQSHSEIKAGSEREFGLVFAALFCIIALWPLPKGMPVKLWALLPAAAFFAIACLTPRLLRPLNILWHKLGMLLGGVIVPVVMSILFFLGITPMGIVMRMLGNDLLRLAFDPHAGSYWIPRSEKNNPMGSMTLPF